VEICPLEVGNELQTVQRLNRSHANMFSTSSILLRPIRDHEYEATQEPYASCFPEDDLADDPKKRQRWLSLETVREDVNNWKGSVIVVEKKATGEVLGFVWYSTVKGGSQGRYPTPAPQVNATGNFEKLNQMKMEWKTELSGSYGKFICPSDV
jgi:hypothetical protein